MGFNITFYKFNKEGNSTKRPSSSGTTYNCRILRGSSIVSPTIELSIGLTTSPDFNYAYIPNFNRYYYVSEWTYNDALWTASLEVDALATYRTEIGSENLYALRTSNPSLYDGRIVDNLYPTKSGCSFTPVPITDMWTNTGGMFIVGVVNDISLPEYQFGSLVYYALTSAQMSKMLAYLMSDSLITDADNGFNLTDASFAIQKSIADPIQYIKECYYLPIPEATITSAITDSATPKVWNWNLYTHTDIGMVSIVKKTSPSIKFNRAITLPKHPQTNSRGAFVNQSPYTILTLLITPFGLIDIDTTVTSNATSLDVEVEIDAPTGLGILTISCNNTIINRIEAQIGVNIPLSQITRDYVGGVTSIVSGVAGIFTGNIAGAISSVASGIGNSVNALTPRSQTIGQGGSYAQLSETPSLYAQFFECVDDDIAKNGRPCCKVVNCSSGGYFLIQDGDVSISGTKAEWEMIKSQLEEGFYWE